MRCGRRPFVEGQFAARATDHSKWEKGERLCAGIAILGALFRHGVRDNVTPLGAVQMMLQYGTV